MRGIYILFSGGYDSAFLINQVLSDMNDGKDMFCNTEITLVSVESNFSLGKVDREIKARKILLDYWKAKYYNIKIDHEILKVDISDIYIKTSRTGLCQPQFWITAIMSCIDYIRYSEIDIMLSYICGDQALAYKHDIETACRSIFNIGISDQAHYPLDILKKPTLNILFPLSIANKDYIIKELFEADEFVALNCTTCEDMENDYCGKCVPCYHLKSTLKNIINDENSTDYIKHSCTRILSRFDKKVEETNNDRETKIEKVL